MSRMVRCYLGGHSTLQKDRLYCTPPYLDASHIDSLADYGSDAGLTVTLIADDSQYVNLMVHSFTG